MEECSEQRPPLETESPSLQQDELLSMARILPSNEEDHEDGYSETATADDIDLPSPSSPRPDRRHSSPLSEPSNYSAHRHSHTTCRDVEAGLDSSNLSRSSSSSIEPSPASTATSASTAAAALAGTAALRALPAGHKTSNSSALALNSSPSCAVKAGRYVRNFGLLFLGIGLLALGAAIFSHTYLPAWRNKKLLTSLVVDSTKHPGYATWANPSSKEKGGGDSPMYQTFYFFHLVNPANFLQGRRPVYLEKGPYTFQQKKKKVEVEFSEDGTLVSYVTLVQNEYKPDKSGADVLLSDEVSMINLAYSTAVATFGSESNLLRVGTRMALGEVERALEAEFLPTLKENALVTGAVKALALTETNLNKLNYPQDGVAIRWGGGCVETGMFTKQCGFEKAPFLKSMMGKEDPRDVEFFQMCLDPGLGSEPGQFIPLATVHELWNTTNPLSIFSVKRVNTSTRVGVSHWLNGDADMRDTLMAHFSLNTYQYTKLTNYVRTIYESPLLEYSVVKNFLQSLPPGEIESANEVEDWSSLVWRQWAVGDVIQTFNGASLPESVIPETPPELSFYLASVGKPVWTTGGVIVGESEAPAPISKARWSIRQTKCLFDTVLRKMDAEIFAEDLLGLPTPPNKTPRKPFVNSRATKTATAEASKAALQECLMSEDAWDVMLGYLDYLGQKLVAPYIQRHVLDAQGGLVVTRSVQSWLEGRVEPILALALQAGDPRIMFGFMGQDKQMEAPGKCTRLADVENAYSACAPVLSAADSKTVSYYKKVANTYHTGKDHPERLGALAKYKGDDVAWGIWPRDSVEILGGAEKEEGSVLQYGFSEGEQFPPLNRIMQATTEHVGEGLLAGLEQTLSTLAFEDGTAEELEKDTDLMVFLAKFIMPLRFRYEGPSDSVQGIEGLMRFGLSPINFSPQRRDAARFSMDGPGARDGLFNLTDLQSTPLFLSTPHYMGYPQLNSLECLSVIAYDPVGEQDAAMGSHLDIDPYTGRTMSAAVRMQLSTSTADGNKVYDVFHDKAYAAEVIPLLWMTQRAEVGPADAVLFKKLCSAPLTAVEQFQRYTLLVGIALTVLGLVMVVAGCFFARRKRSEEKTADSRGSTINIL